MAVRGAVRGASVVDVVHFHAEKQRKIVIASLTDIIIND